MVNKITYLFPGQGSQVIGMAKAYADKSALAKDIFAKADAILGFSLSQLMFEGPEDKLKETDIAQPALFTASAAGLELLKERGLKPTWASGHSLGEYSALYAAGVISFDDGLKLVRARGEAMSEAGKKSPGTMAAIIGLGFDALNKICEEVTKEKGVCVPANYNSESQVVISGDVEAVKLAMEKCTAAGAAKAIQLNVAGAFHSPLMTHAVNIMKSKLEAVSFRDASVSVLTNVDAKETTNANEFKTKLVAQIDHPVLWDQTLKELVRLGTEIFIEVGSGRVLSTMAKKVDRKKTVLCTDEIEAIDKAFASTSSI